MGWSRSLRSRRGLQAARTRVACVLLWLAYPVMAVAQHPAAPQSAATAGTPAAAPAPHRLRIGLVLSGGGARGIAHVGVLQVLQKLHVPIDAIAGTSMGAVVGGLYASGLTPDQIERTIRSMNWQEAFRDRPPREDLTLRRKQEDENFLVKFPIGIKGGRPVLPMGLIQGQSLTEMLRRLTLPVARITSFDDLPTPFRAVATDLETGQEVDMGSGDLTSAMRASLSAPGVFAPVERGGRMLVDGGVSDNVPVDVARAMGVDVLIVVDVGFPLLPRNKLTSVTAISNQMLAILMRRKSEQELAHLDQHDVLIRPALGDTSSFDFGNINRLLGVGAAAAWKMRDRLAALSVGPEQYAAYQEQRELLRRPPPRIDFVKVQTGPEVYSQPIEKLFKDMVGKRLNPDAVGRRITTLYGEGGLDMLDYRVVRRDDEYGLLVDARGNSIGPNYVRFGLSLQDDFAGDSTYDAAMRYVMSEITRAGGEWVTDAEIGQTSLLATEVFLPLSPFSGWFVMPHTMVAARNLPFLIGQSERAQYRVHTFDYGLDAGRQFGNWGEIRAGVYREEGHSRLTIGDPGDAQLPFPAYQTFGSRTYFARLSYDTLDDINFPHFGARAMLQWSGARNVVGGQLSSNQVTFDFLAAHTWRERDTLALWMSGGSTLNRVTDLRMEFPLGGFLNLSGLKQYSLYGPRFGIGRLMFYRKIGRGGPGYFDVPVYLGMSLEAGNVWQNMSDAKFTNLHKDASLFLGLDTFLGPIYLGSGFDDHGDQAYYLFLGRTF
ncbi:MAG TPA: patatin-like phospholipase family protein [Steroidobacteraceae bacterium]|nr:patatin-like phospholipase family protein [Steroidobacteraceae bacterium]